MKNYIFLNLLLLQYLCFVPALAQKRVGEVIYLKNGSVIRNASSMQHLDSLIRVETSEGNSILFKPSEVDRITREKIPSPYTHAAYLLQCEWGIAAGRQHADFQSGVREPATTFSLQIINGYRLNRLVGAGLGIGITTYERGVITPLFGRITGTLLPGRISPIYTIDAGYGFYSHIFNDKPVTDPWSGATYHYFGGFLFNPAVGLQTHLNKHSAFYVLAGYSSQRFHTEVRSERLQSREEEKVIYERLSLRMGVVF